MIEAINGTNDKETSSPVVRSPPTPSAEELRGRERQERRYAIPAEPFCRWRAWYVNCGTVRYRCQQEFDARDLYERLALDHDLPVHLHIDRMAWITEEGLGVILVQLANTGLYPKQ